jgi:parallel beta-helix repeat protein
MKLPRSIPLLSLAVLAFMVTSVSAATRRVPQDFETIQAAVEASASGDLVLVTAGTYRQRIKLKAGITLRSAGDDTPGTLGLARAEATVIDGGGTEEEMPGVAMAEGSVLDGFTIANVGRYDDEAWKRHFETRGDDQLHEEIGAPGVAGVSINAVTCEVRHNIVHHTGGTGIAITGSEGTACAPLIVVNICHRNMGGGIGSLAGSTATIRDNHCFENFFAGIGVDNASPLIENNHCHGNIRAGIGVSEGGCPTVRSNRCHDNRRAGIGIRTGSNTRPVVELNECYENGMAGIGVEEKAAPVLRKNRSFRNLLAGIGVRDGARPTITGNECYENGEAGIGLMSGADTLIVGNFCHHNKAAGIGLSGGGEDNSATLVDNHLIDNAMVAVGVQAGWNVLLIGNELARAEGMPPIVMIFEGASAVLIDNTLRGPGVAGVRVAGQLRAVNNRFTGTGRTGAGPPHHAVWALSGAKVEMTANAVDSWKHALFAEKAEVVATGNTVEHVSGAAFHIRSPSKPPVVQANTLVGEIVELLVE